MNKLILKLSIASLSALAFGSVQAQSATSAAVKFTGTITNSTCSVRDTDRNKEISFGSVPAGTNGFTGTTVGSVALPAYERPIEITLENCSAPGTNGQPSTLNVRVVGPDVLPAGRLKTTNDSVNIQLLENNSTDVWNISNTSRDIPLSAGTPSMKFTARYYVASGNMVNGNASANAVLNMEYK